MTKDMPSIQDFLKHPISEQLEKVELEVKDNITYLGEETVIIIHDFLVDHFKGKNNEIIAGDRYIASLFYALREIKMAQNSADTRKSIIKKASQLIARIASEHLFTDGNKRTAYVTGILFLLINGIDCKSSETDYYHHANFLQSVASKPVGDVNAIKMTENWLLKEIIA